ncbi:MAG: iron-containing alcohol dehydrogenase [Oscillospiraceae bacterium]
MKNFSYYSPTKIVFGRDAQNRTAECVKEFGGSRVLIVYGGKSAKKSGLLDEIKRNLTDNGIEHIEIGGVVPNPRLSLVRSGIKAAIEFGADFFLAVGGGSVIDSTKAIAIGVANPKTDVWDFWLGKSKVEKARPIASVLTISAAGSETSDSAVITDDEVTPHLKRGLNSPLNRPKFAIMNPELTFSLPKYQVAAGVADIIMHTLERYFGIGTGNGLTDEFAEGLLRTMIKNGPVGVEDSHNYDAMSEIMWCGSVSHIGLTGLGSANASGKEGDWSCHQMGHELSAMFDVTHGASLASIWGSWAKYVRDENTERFAQLGARVFHLCDGSVEDVANMAIDKMVGFFANIGMPISLRELIGHVPSESELNALADACSFNGTRKIGAFRVLERDDMYKIYKNASV